jgi:hypothetical protein
MNHFVYETMYLPIINGQIFLSFDRLKYEVLGYEGNLVKAKCIEVNSPNPFSNIDDIEIKEGEIFFLNHQNRTILNKEMKELASSSLISRC